MKKSLSLWLLLAVTVLCGFDAAAYTLNAEWNIPGAVQVRNGSTSAAFESLGADATSYTYEMPASTTFRNVYFYAADGYALSEVTCSGTMAGATSFPNGWYSINLNSSNRNKLGDPGKITIKVVKIERNETFTVNVANGASTLTGSFESDKYTIPQLVDGKNTVHFSSAIDKQFKLTCSAGKIYSLKIDGTEIQPKEFYGTFRYENLPVTPGCTVDIQVYEKAVEDAVLTIQMPEALKGCINSIRNWTSSSFVQDDIVDNTLTLAPGTDLQFNLNEDYTYTKFTLGGKDITADFKDSNNSIRFKVEESTVFAIEGTAKTYKQIPFTATVINSEGVDIAVNKFGSAPIDLGDGKLLTSDQTKGDYTFKAGEAVVFSFSASEKTPYAFVSPKAGWYIKSVLNSKGEEIPNPSTSEGTSVWIVAEKYVQDASFDIKVVGSKLEPRLSSSAKYTGLWQNPESYFNYKMPTAATTNVKYVAGYDNPFDARYLAISESDVVGMYLDGYKLVPNDDGIYAVDPYFPTSDKMPLLTVYASGASAGSAYVMTVTCADGITATGTYSELNRPFADLADKDKNILLKGTPVTIKFNTTACQIMNGKTVIHGFDANGNFVNGLNANGEYTFTMSKLTQITAAPIPTFSLNGVVPAAGATVKKIAGITVLAPMFEGSENMPYTTDELVKGITLTSASGTTVSASSLGEAEMNAEGTGFNFPVIFEPAVTEAGEYTLRIPLGTFFEAAWDDAAEGFAPVSGGSKSEELTVKYTVDPTLKSKLDTYTITPAAGSAIRSLDKVVLTFTNLAATDMVQSSYTETATLSNGTQTFDCSVSPNGVGNQFNVTFMDANYEDVTVSADGTWTLKFPEGFFSFGDDSSPFIESIYTIGANLPQYPITPTPGQLTSDLSKITITITGCETSEYTEKVIILKGGEYFKSQSTFVESVPGSNVYTVSFSPAPTEEGEYTVTFPAGTFTVDGKDSEEVTATFNYQPEWKLTPMPGSVVKDFSHITLEFPFAKTAQFSGERFMITLSMGGAYAVSNFIVTEVEGAEHPTFDIALDAESQRPPTGYLDFTVEEGAFIVDGKPNSIFSVSYYSLPDISLEYTADPEKYIINEGYGMATFAFIFDEQSDVSIYAEEAVKKFTVTINGKPVPATTLTGFENGESGYILMAENNFLLGYLVGSYVTEGEFHVTAEAGAFYVGLKTSPALDYTWTIVEPKEFDINVTPNDQLYLHETDGNVQITVTFPGAQSVTYDEGFIIRLEENNYNNGRYNEIGTVTPLDANSVVKPAATSDPGFVITFPAVEKKTNYKLTIPYSSFYVDGVYPSPSNGHVTSVLAYNGLTGVEGVAVDSNTEATVVTLDGRVIYKAATPEQINELPAGFYIINGKKTFVK